jgi:hypothetical protein
MSDTARWILDKYFYIPPYLVQKSVDMLLQVTDGKLILYDVQKTILTRLL